MRTVNIIKRLQECPPLPFFPRSTGINDYPHGKIEDIPGIDAVEICWVDSGACEFEIEGRPVILTKDESLYKLPGERRKKTVLSSEKARIYWATFDGPNAKKFMLDFAYPRRALKSGKCPEHLFSAIARGLLSNNPNDLRNLIGVYAELIALMAEKTIPQKHDAFLDECLFLVNTEYSDPDFDIHRFAKKMGVHRSTLLRLMKEKEGMSPMEFLTQFRLKQALDLLRRTFLNVEEIAAQTGFSHTNYFCRVIRKHTGKTPLEYRESR